MFSIWVQIYWNMLYSMARIILLVDLRFFWISLFCSISSECIFMCLMCPSACRIWSMIIVWAYDDMQFFAAFPNDDCFHINLRNFSAVAAFGYVSTYVFNIRVFDLTSSLLLLLCSNVHEWNKVCWRSWRDLKKAQTELKFFYFFFILKVLLLFQQL